MKNIYLSSITSVALSVFLMACGAKNEESIETLIASGNIESIRAKRSELTEMQKSLESRIKILDSAISAKDDNKKLPLVTTFKAKIENFDHYVELQGDVTTKQNVLIYPEVAGLLQSVRVKEGQQVSKGQLLATIDNGGLNNQLEQMKTQLALAKTTFEKQEKLWAQKVGSEIQYLQAKANYEAQENAVAQMESQLDKFSIRAPFSGIIDDVIKDQGTIVSPGPGSEVFRLVNLSEMHIEVSVPESYLGSVTPGKKVKVYFPILNRTIESKVRQTGNYINPNNRSFSVEIPVPNVDGMIKPNLTAKVQINDYRNEKAILIPQSIISENAEGEQYTYVATKINGDNVGVAVKNIIQTGRTQGDFIEVLSGIESGADVIREGARSVKDGQEIKILTK